jgi:hypothetical protein
MATRRQWSQCAESGTVVPELVKGHTVIFTQGAAMQKRNLAAWHR